MHDAEATADATDATADDPDAAVRVVVSYPADLSERGRWRVEQPYFRNYLRKVHDEARVGDRWEEFTDVGCCGSQLHLAFRVERVEGGERIGPETEIECVEGEACGAEGGWEVQNEFA